MSSRVRYVHLTVPLILMLCLAFINVISRGLYHRLVVEDGPIEWATAGVYFIVSVLGFGLAKRNAKRDLACAVFFVLMSVGFLFVALEEISWGQRIFRLDTPEFFKGRNVQGEIGLHNLSSVRLLLSPAYIAVGFGGAFGSLALSWLGVPERIRRRFLPPPYLVLYFAPCGLFYLIAEIISPLTTVRYMGQPGAVAAIYGGKIDDPRGILALPAYAFDAIRDWLPMLSGLGGTRSSFWRHQEPAEFLLSLGFLFFIVSWRSED